MLSLSARAIALSALFILPMLPSAPAQGVGDACETPCRVIALYVQPGGGALSAFAGDAMRTDAATVSGGNFYASSRPISAPIDLPKNASFVVHIHSPTETPWGVAGSVRVMAVDGAGTAYKLAERTFLAPPVETAVVPRTITAPIDAAGRGVQKTAADSYGGLQTDNMGSMLAARSHDAACSNDAACATTGGAPRLGTYRPCAPSAPDALIPRLTWTAVQAADQAARDQIGEGVCGRSIWPAVNDSGASVDEAAPGGIELPPFPGYPETGNDSASPPAWRNFTLNATPPAWMRQNHATFTIPDGLRLRLDVDLRAVAGSSGVTPLVIEYGRADTPTRLELRTSTPGAFGMFAYDAEPIGAGRHTGTFANLTDADDFTFVPPAGARTVLQASGSPNLIFTLWDVDGNVRAGTGSLSTNASSPRWFLRIAPTATPIPPQEYTFTLSHPAPSDDLRIEDGTHEGGLGDGDPSDAYTFFAWKGQHVELRLEHADDVEYALRVGYGFWDTTEDNDSFSGRPLVTSDATVVVERVYGSGPYTLTLDRNDAENHTVLPNVSTVATLSSVQAMKGHGTGVDVLAGETLYHVRPGQNASVLLTNVSSGTHAVGRNSDGRFLVHDDPTRSIALRDQHGTLPLLTSARSATFGPDALYAIRNSDVIRLREDRNETHIYLFGAREGILALPDGRIVATAADGAHILDFENGIATRAPAFDGIRAVDLEGNGYFLRQGSLIMRRDLSTLETTLAAQTTGTIRDLAFSDDALYASMYDGMIVRAAIPGGFAGFEPEFDPLPPADLVVVNASDEIVGYRVVNGTTPTEEHRLRITIENQGDSDAETFAIDASVDGIKPVWSNRTFVPRLAAGEREVVEITWSVRLQTALPGDKTAMVDLDPWDEITESNETNNRLAFTTHVLAGGNYDACMTALKSISPPWPLPYSAEVLCGTARV